jgi:hypothetical protein
MNLIIQRLSLNFTIVHRKCYSKIEVALIAQERTNLQLYQVQVTVIWVPFLSGSCLIDVTTSSPSPATVQSPSF